MTFFIGLVAMGIMVGSIYGLVALGFVLIFKSSGVFNIAQGQLVVVGGYIYYMLFAQVGLPFYLAFLLTLVLSYFFGFIIQRLCLRPLVGQPLISVIMVTVGIFVLIEGLVRLIWGVEPHKYPTFLPTEGIYIGPMYISWEHIFGFSLTILALIAFAIYFRFTRGGLKMRAVAESEHVAQSLGIDVGAVYGQAWGLSALTAAIGGVALATVLSLAPELSFIGLKAFPAVLVGGFESIPGAVVGGVIIGIAESLAGGYLDRVLSAIKDITPYIVLMIILLVWPYGIWGLKRIERI
jgi:branched-chain amino acid transport system permease protein